MQGRRDATAFFYLTFALSVPFYVLSALAHLEIILEPAAGPLFIGLFTITPIAAAWLMTSRREGKAAARALLRTAADRRWLADKRWASAVLLLIPALYVVACGFVLLVSDDVPAALIPMAALPATLIFFLVLATAEEVGWMGYAYGPMATKHGGLVAALRLGVVWGLWHAPFFVFMVDGVTLVADVLALVGTRVLIVWIFENTNWSVSGSIVAHAVSNVAFLSLPDFRAVAPLGSVVLCGLVLVLAVVVAKRTEARTLRVRRPREFATGLMARPGVPKL